MTWEQRLKPAIYTSPSGVEFNFDYEDLASSQSKKTSAWNFPDTNGTYIQDNGTTGRSYPFRAIFHGADNDLEAAAFENALLEKGEGRLSHPVYGDKTVVPFGSINTRINLKSAAGQTIVDVTFFDTIGLIYPFNQDDPRSSVKIAIGEFNEALSDEFSENTEFDSEFERLSFQNQFLAVLDQTRSTFNEITKAEKDVNDKFNDVYNSINNGIDILVAQPATLAFQTAILAQTPGLLTQSLTDRIDGYKDLINSLIGGNDNVQAPTADNTGNNTFFSKDLWSTSYLSGYVESVTNWQFDTKSEALGVADDILQTFQEIAEWRDDNFESLDLIDTGAEYQSLQEMVALTAGFLVQIAFTLKTERIIILDRARSIVDLVAELYGEVDSQLDFFIDSNNLAGFEYLELPKGREIRYFV